MQLTLIAGASLALVVVGSMRNVIALPSAVENNIVECENFSFSEAAMIFGFLCCRKLNFDLL